MIQIKSIKKLFSFSILIIMLVLAVNISARGNSKNTYKKIVVLPGDTLWNIVQTYENKNKDMNETIFEIEKLNKLQSPVIIPGQQLLIPED